MAPSLNIWEKSGRLYYPELILAVHPTVILSICFTLLYVGPLYLSSATRPSRTLSRDADSVIKGRVRIVTITSFVSSLVLFLFLVFEANITPLESLHLMGWFPVDFSEIARSLLLVILLFLGPLFEAGIADAQWQIWVSPSSIKYSLSRWMNWRNYIAGPITEEVVFRSILVTLHLLAGISATRIVFLTPLYFGIAHINHLYESRFAYPWLSLPTLIISTIFRFGFTTVFGWLATFVYVRTASLPAVILIHSFCNYCGLPRLWGRLYRDDYVDGVWKPARKDEKKRITWTVLYYFFLFGGLGAFVVGLWPLTESKRALAAF